MAFVNLGQVVYPIGSIYMSTNSTSPANLFGGSWTRITDAYLRAIGDTGAAIGEYGGYAEYKLSVSQLPSHSHGFKFTWNAGGPGNYANWHMVVQQAELGSHGWVNETDSANNGISLNGGGGSISYATSLCFCLHVEKNFINLDVMPNGIC